MKYILQLRARPKPEISAEQKHDRLMKGLRHLPVPWGLRASKWTSARDPGTLPMRIISLTKLLGPGLKGSVHYANRKHLPDAAKADDWLTLDFDPTKAPYDELVSRVFAAYITAFDAYVATIQSEELNARDFDRWQRSRVDARSGVFRINAVNFLDALLCRRAFSLTPAQVVHRLSGHVDRVVELEGGVLVVVDSRVLPTEEIRRIDGKVRPLLTESVV